MTENKDSEKKQGFYVVQKGQGESFRSPQNLPENKQTGGKGFLTLRQQLSSLQRQPNPDPAKEAEIRGEIEDLFKEAKQAGLFIGVKSQIERTQGRIGDPDLGKITYQQAIRDIASFDSDSIEENERRNLGSQWKDEYVGMIQEYENVAAMAMDHAWLVAEASRERDPLKAQRLSERAGKLEQQINLHKFGDIPSEPYTLAEEAVDLFLAKHRGSTGPGTSIDKAAQAMEKSAEAQARMARGEYTLDIKGLNPEQQRAVLREYLDDIENSHRDTQDIANAYLVRSLEAALDKMDAKVAREVRARLAVHDCSELMKQANGWIRREAEKVGPGYAIGSAATAAEDRGHALTGSIVETFFYEIIDPEKPDTIDNRSYFLPGLDIPLAWNQLQDINNRERYDEIVSNLIRGIADKKEQDKLRIEENERDDKGKCKINFFKDGNPKRKEMVEGYVIGLILHDSRIPGGLDSSSAKKSFQLAQKLAKASLEESVFDKGATTVNDQAGEIFGLKEWRKERWEKGRARGPMIHEDAIEGFGSSWIRLSTEHHDNGSALTAEEIVKSINKDKVNWVYYCTVTVNRYKALSLLILDLEPKPDSATKASLQEAVVYFLTADKPELTDNDLRKLFPGEMRKIDGLRSEDEKKKRKKELKEKEKKPVEKYLSKKKNGNQKLRTWWAAGVVDMALANVFLDWDSVSLERFGRVITKETLSDNTGTFLTEADWDWIKKATNYDRRLLGLEFQRTLKGLQGRK